MNLRSFRYFLKIAEHGSITQAALALHISQPSLTQHLRHLEDYFGMPLFMRHGRGIILTEAGSLLRLRGEILIDEIDSLRSELDSKAVVPRGALHVGMPISWSEHVTYPAIERFHKEYPDVRVRLMVNASANLATAMGNNEIQLAVLSEMDDASMFWTTPILKEELFLIGPRSCGLNGLPPIHFSKLSEYPLILPVRTTKPGMLAAIGLNMNAVMEAPSNSILPLVARGVAYTVMSAGALPSLGNDGAYECVQVLDRSMSWSIATPKNRPKSAAVKVFEGILLSELSDAVTSGRWRTARMLTEAPPG